MSDFSNQDLLHMLQMLKRSFNPGSETTAFNDFKKIDWNSVSVDCRRSAPECRNAFAAYILGISPHRNAHEILSLAESRLRPFKHIDFKLDSGSSGETMDENSQMGAVKPVVPKGVPKSKNMTSIPASVAAPQSPLQIFVAKTCERTEAEEASLSKLAWKEKYANLKPEKKIKYIKLAIRDDIRFQQELQALNDKTLELPPRFIYLTKKDLELFLHHNGFDKLPLSGYGLYVSEALGGAQKDENMNLQQKMKEVAGTWKNMSTIRQQEYVSRCNRQRDERQQHLQTAGPEVMAAEKFLRKHVFTNSANTGAANQKRKLQAEKEIADSPSPAGFDENSNVANLSPSKNSPSKKVRRQSEVDYSAGTISPIV